MALAITATDQFNDLSAWTDHDLGSVNSVASGGTLTQACVTSGGWHYGEQHRAVGDLTGNRVVVEVVEAVAVNASVEMGMSVGPTINTDDAGFRLRDGTLSWRTHVGGSEALGSIATFSASTHHWWMIADLGGEFLWATSPDGFDWTVHRTAAHALSLSSVTLSLWAGTFASVASPGTARWDNLNLWLPLAAGDVFYLLTGGYGGDDPDHIVTHGYRSLRLAERTGVSVTASMTLPTEATASETMVTTATASMTFPTTVTKGADG